MIFLRLQCLFGVKKINANSVIEDYLKKHTQNYNNINSKIEDKQIRNFNGNV